MNIIIGKFGKSISFESITFILYLGPGISARIAKGKFISLDAVRAFFISFICSFIFPWDKFILATDIPFLISCFILEIDFVEGPKVQTILVLGRDLTKLGMI